MSFCATNDDRYLHFIYNGVAYGNGTKVSLKNSFINNYTYNGKKIWKYAWFGNRVVVNGQNMYFFSKDKTDWNFLHRNNIDLRIPQQCCPFFLIREDLIDYAIEEITHPVIVSVSHRVQEKDYANESVMWMWFIYVFVMIISLVFKEFYLIWIVASIIFFSWRKEKLN